MKCRYHTDYWEQYVLHGCRWEAWAGFWWVTCIGSSLLLTYSQWKCYGCHTVHMSEKSVQQATVETGVNSVSTIWTVISLGTELSNQFAHKPQKKSFFFFDLIISHYFQTPFDQKLCLFIPTKTNLTSVKDTIVYQKRAQAILETPKWEIAASAMVPLIKKDMSCFLFLRKISLSVTRRWLVGVTTISLWNRRRLTVVVSVSMQLHEIGRNYRCQYWHVVDGWCHYFVPRHILHAQYMIYFKWLPCYLCERSEFKTHTIHLKSEVFGFAIHTPSGENTSPVHWVWAGKMATDSCRLCVISAESICLVAAS